MITRIIDGRDTGKTRKLLEACAEAGGGYFICKHPERVHEKCLAYGIDDKNIWPLGYTEAAKASNGSVYIDELETFITATSSFVLSGYTMTLEKEHEPDVLEQAKKRLGE